MAFLRNSMNILFCCFTRFNRMYLPLYRRIFLSSTTIKCNLCHITQAAHLSRSEKITRFFSLHLYTVDDVRGRETGIEGAMGNNLHADFQGCMRGWLSSVERLRGWRSPSAVAACLLTKNRLVMCDIIPLFLRTHPFQLRLDDLLNWARRRGSIESELPRDEIISWFDSLLQLLLRHSWPAPYLR